MSDTAEPEKLHYRIRREAGGVLSWLRSQWQALRAWHSGHWQSSKRFRLANYVLGAFLALLLVLWFAVARNLPSAEKLLDYQPPLPTMVRGVNGEIVYSYARERRVQLRYVDFPEQLKNAYLAAED